MLSNLRIQAEACADRSAGRRAEAIQVISGAAGDPKWLIHDHVDRFFFGGWIKRRRTSLYLVGSSSGLWCFAAAAQTEPLAALDRLGRA